MSLIGLHQHRFHSLRGGVLAAIAAAVTGCGGSGPELAEVEGVVTVDGEPMPYVGVVFHPEIGPIATGNTDAEGRFRLVTTNRRGALVGDHVVTLSGGGGGGVRFEAAEGNTLGAPSAQKPAAGGPRFSSHYARTSTSDLRVTVEAGKRNEFQFELKKEGA